MEKDKTLKKGEIMKNESIELDKMPKEGLNYNNSNGKKIHQLYFTI